MNDELVKMEKSMELESVSNRSLETERLRLLPLKAEELSLAIKDYKKMQTELGLKVVNTSLDEEMQYAMEVRLRKVLEDTSNYLWLTNWAIINQKQNQIIGFIMLKGYPSVAGEVIVGYGIDRAYRGNRYATEALEGLVEWIFKDPKVLFVIADTEKGNVASHKVLENVGAVKYKETDELIWWRIENK